MTTEKFLVYFFLIAFYMVYSEFADVPQRAPEQAQAIAITPAPNVQANARSVQ